MSDIIQVLPDSVANQIAAGEVIQRPASVIKELVENAVDAGAKSIDVIVVDSGRTSIQVIDDGKGMSETDARLSFERHATSKIRNAADLFTLHTMGFRGEALASIAAVAQVELTTRMETDELGSKISISGSRVLNQEPVSCSAGSNFVVSNLFFNVPARRRFLKSNATELSNIITAYERIVLVNPQISFTLHNNGTEIYNLPAGNRMQRIVDVFGKKLNQDLLPLEVNTTMARISGYVGRPESARRKGAHQFFFVNDRYMRHPVFHKAVMNAYERMLPIGEQVPYFIYFDISPEEIDVNIHPTKTEIKFENESAVWQILEAGVKEALGKFVELPSIDFDTQNAPEIPAYNPDKHPSQPRPEVDSSYNPFRNHSVTHQPANTDWTELYGSLHKSEGPLQQNLFGDEADDSDLHLGDNAVSDRSPEHYQYKGTYIMTSVKSGLMIIDQHRAHVRILYDTYLQQFDSGFKSSQRMLFPEAVQFTVSEMTVVEKIMPDLQTIGFELTDLGGNSFAVNSVPGGIEGVNYITLLHDIVSSAVEKGTADNTEVHRSVALTLARSAAIPQGQILSNEEMENIVDQLFACQNANYTPDGKNILCILPQQDIEHLLG
jgi:DNA mismatch repair protein MutL